MAVRNNALILAEAGNLLKMPRPVAPTRPITGVTFEPPGPDDLSPAQIETLLKQNRTPFNAFAQKLTDAALMALRAVDARSVEGLYEAGDAIDQACENCHMTYWYPRGPTVASPKARPCTHGGCCHGSGGRPGARGTNRRPSTDQPPSRTTRIASG